jgi:fermentation-respiration switch protein FrsA (DUF1100 family)
LDEIGHPNKLVTYANDDHFLRKNRDAAVAEVVAWFRAHAKRAAEAVATPVAP